MVFALGEIVLTGVSTPVNPLTSVGTDPQQRSSPIELSAHVVYGPAAMAVMVPESPTTEVGTVTGPLALPSPSWPSVLRPQHFTSLVSSSAQ